MAYYCFINLGWPPSKYLDLPYRERLLVAEFAIRDMKNRKEEQEKARQKTQRR